LARRRHFMKILARRRAFEGAKRSEQRNEEDSVDGNAKREISERELRLIELIEAGRARHAIMQETVELGGRMEKLSIAENASLAGLLKATEEVVRWKQEVLNAMETAVESDEVQLRQMQKICELDEKLIDMREAKLLRLEACKEEKEVESARLGLKALEARTENRQLRREMDSIRGAIEEAREG
ncbi:hypothetical protein PMAYCL1PPCAC_01031, partial [Pristionchus mayeri]